MCSVLVTLQKFMMNPRPRGAQSIVLHIDGDSSLTITHFHPFPVELYRLSFLVLPCFFLSRDWPVGLNVWATITINFPCFSPCSQQINMPDSSTSTPKNSKMIRSFFHLPTAIVAICLCGSASCETRTFRSLISCDLNRVGSVFFPYYFL